MCLRIADEPKVKEGIGWKLVRPGKNPGEFTSEYQKFAQNGNGGVGTQTDFDGETWKVKTVYKEGRTNRVRHYRESMTWGSRMKYRAGIHLYLTQGSAEVEHRWTAGTVIKRFAYKKAVTTDGQVVVALEVTLLPNEE